MAISPILTARATSDYLELRSSEPISLPLSNDQAGATVDLENLPGWLALEELWEDELATEKESGYWRIPYSRIYEASISQLRHLGIRMSPPVRSYVGVSGIPGRGEIKLVVEVESTAHGRLEGAVERSGPFYMPPGESPFLVERNLGALLDLADAGPEDNGLEDHLEFLARSKNAALECGANLDAYLEREDYYQPDRVAVNVDVRAPDRLELSAQLLGDQSPEIPPERLMACPPRKVETVRSGNKRSRVVLSDSVRKQIDGIQASRTITGADVPRFAENPEAYLPAGIDLSEFSKRVRGIRSITYNSRPYLHLRESSGGWFEGIPGIDLEPVEDVDGVDSGDSPVQRPDGLSPETYEELARRARETGDEYVRHGDGWVHIDAERADDFLGTLDRLGGVQEGVVRAPRSAVLDIYENLEALEFDVPPRGDLGLDVQTELPDPPVPDAFRGALRPYQRLGYRWMANLDSKQTGGLLADDMGLGKTVQVIAHLARLQEAGQLAPTLIVCPKTLIPNWRREIAVFFPEFGAITELAGSKVHSSDLERCGIVIGSYDTVRRGQLEIAKVDWQCIVSDEAQYAKNPTAQRTSALKALKATHRFALTGTPVENGMIEFWCIMDFVRPGLLGSWTEFRTEYERPLVSATSEEERGPIVKRLLKVLGPHYLRRLKADVLTDLPALRVHRHEAYLSDSQLAAYSRIASAARDGGQGAALAAITHLLMVSGHPQALGDRVVSYVPGESPKLDTVLSILADVEDRAEKALVFTRFKSLQRIVQLAVRERFGVWPDIINGDLTTNRQQVIDIFQQQPGFNVLILSQEVGGVGLNLVEANHFIHFTRPWNPAKENQATDRVYRIGQNRPVAVHLPIATHPDFTTVEERLDELLGRKSQLARDVLRPSNEMKVRPEELLDCVSVIGQAGEDTAA